MVVSHPIIIIIIKSIIIIRLTRWCRTNTVIVTYLWKGTTITVPWLCQECIDSEASIRRHLRYKPLLFWSSLMMSLSAKRRTNHLTVLRWQSKEIFLGQCWCGSYLRVGPDFCFVYARLREGKSKVRSHEGRVAQNRGWSFETLARLSNLDVLQSMFRVTFTKAQRLASIAKDVLAVASWVAIVKDKMFSSSIQFIMAGVKARF